MCMLNVSIQKHQGTGQSFIWWPYLNDENSFVIDLNQIDGPGMIKELLVTCLGCSVKAAKDLTMAITGRKMECHFDNKLIILNHIGD